MALLVCGPGMWVRRLAASTVYPGYDLELEQLAA